MYKSIFIICFTLLNDTYYKQFIAVELRQRLVVQLGHLHP